MITHKPTTFSFMLMTLMFSILAMLSASSWLMIWFAMEINMFTFLPMLMYAPSALNSEVTIKYLIIQSSSSSLFMISLVLMAPASHLPQLLIILTMLIKLAIAPLHQWILTISTVIQWGPLLLLLTWQKLGPLCLLSTFFSHQNIMHLTLIALMSAFIGSFGAFNQTLMRPLLVFSSINHMGWMLLALFYSLFLMIIYLTMYFIILFILILTLFYSHPHQAWAASSILTSNKTNNLSTGINLLSLAGLPPLLGFSMKWLALMALTPTFPLSVMLLLVTSCMSLVFYLHITFTLFMSKITISVAHLFPWSLIITVALNCAALPMFMLT